MTGARPPSSSVIRWVSQVGNGGKKGGVEGDGDDAHNRDGHSNFHHHGSAGTGVNKRNQDQHLLPSQRARLEAARERERKRKRAGGRIQTFGSGARKHRRRRQHHELHPAWPWAKIAGGGFAHHEDDVFRLVCSDRGARGDRYGGRFLVPGSEA